MERITHPCDVPVRRATTPCERRHLSETGLLHGCVSVVPAPQTFRESDEAVHEKFAEILLKAAFALVFSTAILLTLFRAFRALVIWWASATGRM